MEKHEFQSEARQVLELMIHSVYSNPDIFLRELISNASDAIDKLRIEGLRDEALADLAKEGKIAVAVDKEKKILVVSDNGIGMSHDELVSYLGTIARSGTKEFVRAMKEAASSGNGDLIGQFGVGFYSCFIVADHVTVETRKAGAGEAWRWDSTGDGTYTLEPCERDSHGTSVTLHVREKSGDEDTHVEDYLSAWKLRGIVKRYSDFVAYPIYVEEAGAEKKDDEKEEPANSMKALWTRAESEVSDEEYGEFYRHVTHDWEDPLERIVYKAEGTSEFHALLYIPARPPMDLFYRDGHHGVQLYIRRVFIMNDCRDLIPEYLRFVKGVVDSEDLSLNVSREILQQDRRTAQIKSGLTRKVLDALKRMKQDKPDEYKKFWNAFGMVLKEGIVSDAKNAEAIMKLCLLDSSRGGKTTLDDYVSAMRDGQKSIYYLTGGPVSVLADSPKLETLKARDVEVLLLGDPVDEMWVNTIRTFGDVPFVSVSADELEIFDTPDEEKKQDVELEKTGFVAKLKEALGNAVEDVKLSARLVDSPATFVQKGEPISPQMRHFFQSMGQEVPEEKRVLELNPSHPLIRKFASEAENADADFASWGTVLTGLAAIADGEPVEKGREFTKALEKLLGQ